MPTPRPVFATTAFLLVLVAAGPAFGAGEPSPTGPEFQVNAITTGGQYFPSLATRPDGSFILAWTSYHLDLGETMAAVLAADGTVLVPEFQVNTYTTNNQGSYLDVAVAPDGGFVVAWKAQEDAVDTSAWSTHVRRYDAAGAPSTDPILVNTWTTGHQNAPAVTFLAGGDFVVAFHSDGSLGDDTSSDSIQVRRFSSAGTPTGPELQVNAYTTGIQIRPDVVATPDGGFLVVWEDGGEDLRGGGVGAHLGVYGRRFDASGTAVGSETRLDDGIGLFPRSPRLAAVPDGFVAVWRSLGIPGDDDWSARGRRLDGAGLPIGGELHLNVYTGGEQIPTVAAAEPSGEGFVVTWLSDDPPGGQDGSEDAARGRRFALDGSPVGGEFPVNSLSAGRQVPIGLGFVGDSRFAVSFQSDESAGDDADPPSIQVRFFDLPFFHDGFESGDTTAWSG